MNELSFLPEAVRNIVKEQTNEEKVQEQNVQEPQNPNLLLLKGYLRSLSYQSDNYFFFEGSNGYNMFNIKFTDDDEKHEVGTKLQKAMKASGYEGYNVFEIRENSDYRNYTVSFDADTLPLKWKIIRDIMSEYADYSYDDHKRHLTEKENLEKIAEEDGITKEALLGYLSLMGTQDGFGYYNNTSNPEKPIIGFYIKFKNQAEKARIQKQIDEVLKENGGSTYNRIVKLSDTEDYKNFSIWINDYDKADKLFLVKKIVESLTGSSYAKYDKLANEADDGW